MAENDESNYGPTVVDDRLIEAVDNFFEMSHNQDVFLRNVENQFFTSAGHGDLQADELLDFLSTSDNVTVQSGQFDGGYSVPKPSVAYVVAPGSSLTADEMGLIQEFSLDLLDSTKTFPGTSTNYSQMVNGTSQEGSFHLSARALGGVQHDPGVQVSDGFDEMVSPILQLNPELVDFPETSFASTAAEFSPASFEPAVVATDATPTILAYDDVIGGDVSSDGIVQFEDELLSLLMTDASMVESPATSTSSNDDDAGVTPTLDVVTPKSLEGDDGVKSVPANSIGAQTYLCPVCGNQVI